MGKYRNIRYTNEGYSVTVGLSQFNSDEKYKGYAASCQYKYNKNQEKYILKMWLMHNSIDGKYKIEFEGIDTQPISGTRETIRENICKIVSQMMQNRYFDDYIDQYEFEMLCFDKGHEIIEQEGINNNV